MHAPFIDSNFKNMLQAHSYLEDTIIFLQVLAKYTFPVIVYFSAIEIDLYSFYRKKLIATLKTREKLIG